MSEIYYSSHTLVCRLRSLLLVQLVLYSAKSRNMSANTLHEGFGRRISWEDDGILPPGHQMTFKQALHIVSGSFMLKLVIPDWAPGFTQQIRDTRLAFDELQVLMLHNINSPTEYLICVSILAVYERNDQRTSSCNQRSQTRPFQQSSGCE